jgi:conjugal transfer pilus assembly protein TraK
MTGSCAFAWAVLGAGGMLGCIPCAAKVRTVGPLLFAIGVLGLTQPVNTDQSLRVADNGTVACTASLKDLTRFSLAGDQLAPHPVVCR